MQAQCDQQQIKVAVQYESQPFQKVTIKAVHPNVGAEEIDGRTNTVNVGMQSSLR
jgi:hypothetical protein